MGKGRSTSVGSIGIPTQGRVLSTDKINGPETNGITFSMAMRAANADC